MDVQRTLYREDHEMFRITVRRFLEREFPSHSLQGERACDLERGFFLKAGREGLLCVTLPKEFGGGGDFGHAAVVCEELARAGVDDRALSLHSDVIAPCIASLGNDEQKRRWLPDVCSGQAILALAVAEPGSRHLRTRAVRGADHLLINGSKTCVGNGMTGDLVLLACRTEAQNGEAGISLIMVETDRAGVSRSPSPQGKAPAAAAEFSFVNVRVPMGNLLGEAGRGMDYLDRAWGQERLLLAVFAASRLEYLLDLTLAHVQQPNGTGHCSWDLQYTRIRMAEIKARAVALRVLVDFYLERRMRHPLAAEHAAIAHLYASETLGKCTDELSRLRTTQGRLRTHSIAHAVVDHSGAGKPLHEIIALAL